MRMLIVSAAARWGPMHPSEIERMLDLPRAATTGRAARYLESRGVVFLNIFGKRDFTIELDERHPCYKQIYDFGLALYSLYVKPEAFWQPSKRRKSTSPSKPEHDPAELDMHVLGDTARMRMLHLVNEANTLTATEILNALGLSYNGYIALQHLEDYDLLRSKVADNVKYMRLNSKWPAHRSLRALLSELNVYLPEYTALALAETATPRIHPRLKSWATRKRKVAIKP